MGASAEPRDASARRGKAVALPTISRLGGLMLACGRTGAVGGPHRRITIVRATHAAQPVSTKALGEVHTRMTTRIGAPQVGQRATSGGGGLRCGGGHRWGGPARSGGGWSRAGWHSWHGASRNGGLS